MFPELPHLAWEGIQCYGGNHNGGLVMEGPEYSKGSQAGEGLDIEYICSIHYLMPVLYLWVLGEGETFELSNIV